MIIYDYTANYLGVMNIFDYIKNKTASQSVSELPLLHEKHLYFTHICTVINFIPNLLQNVELLFSSTFSFGR